MILSGFVNIMNLSHCLSKFDLISLAQLKYIILHLKPTASLHDVLPSRLFKEVVDTIGSSILSIINSSHILQFLLNQNNELMLPSHHNYRN